MFRKYSILLALSCLSFSTALDNSEKSRVLFFEHEGWGDSAFASAEGNIVSVENGTKTKLQGVEVSAIDSNGHVFRTAHSDSNGLYGIATPYGLFTLVYKKSNYQSLIITNYQSVDDMYSYIDIALEKGEGQVHYTLPDTIQFGKKWRL